jgi:hypothetical protein
MTEAPADFAAVRHILGSPSIAGRTDHYVGADDFDWPGLLREAETMSTGEGVLVRIAYDLWEANGVVSVWELARRLDGRAFERVVDALYISRGDLDPGREPLPAAA